MNDLIHSAKPAGPVECLGMTFPSEDARREYFLELLAEKLKNPAYRDQEGFPKGSDEAILSISDPPYYTACPNPWLADFMKLYGKPYDPAEEYSREPMAIDVTAGKSDPVYKAHSYHTKVPHLAIVPSILHYTKPGDIILDGFAGSGMTGVAAQWCVVAPAQYRAQLESEWTLSGLPSPNWGSRPTILADLSPVATFIADNYNHPLDIEGFLFEANRIFVELEAEYGWMYSVSDGIQTGRIDFTVWSEIFNCPECAGQILFHDHALVMVQSKVRGISFSRLGDIEAFDRRKKDVELADSSPLEGFGVLRCACRCTGADVGKRVVGSRCARRRKKAACASVRRIQRSTWLIQVSGGRREVDRASALVAPARPMHMAPVL